MLWVLLIGSGNIAFGQTEHQLVDTLNQMEGVDTTQREVFPDRASILMKFRRPEKVFALLGEEIPDFTLVTLGQDTIRKKDVLGKRVLLNFWFTNCQPCIDEMPILNSIKAQLSQKEVEFLAITYENKQAVAPFLKNHEFNFTHIVNGRPFIDELGIMFYPKTIVIDENGLIKKIEKQVDLESEGSMEKWMQMIMKELIEP